MRLSTIPVRHSGPPLAVQIDGNGKSVVYTGETECDASIAQFSSGADLLIHDANESSILDPDKEPFNHTTAYGAGETAQLAGATRLALVHIQGVF